MGNKGRPGGSKKGKKTTTMEVVEDNTARVVEGGDHGAGGSQAQERRVVESPRSDTRERERTDSETEDLRRQINTRSKRKRVESVESENSSEGAEEERQRGRAKKGREEDLRKKITEARKRVGRETEARGRSDRARSVEGAGRRRSRSRDRAESEDARLEKMRIKMERMEEKLKYLQTGRRWNSASNEKQFIHQAELKSIVIDDFRMELERHFGARGREVPASIEEVIKRGEEKIEERIKCLKLADKSSWLAVDHYVRDPLCQTDEDDRRWKRAIREAKEEMESRKKNPGRQNNDRQRDGFKKDGFKSVGSEKETRACHRCGKSGHLKRDCRSTFGKDGHGRRDGRH